MVQRRRELLHPPPAEVDQARAGIVPLRPLVRRPAPHVPPVDLDAAVHLPLGAHEQALSAHGEHCNHRAPLQRRLRCRALVHFEGGHVQGLRGLAGRHDLLGQLALPRLRLLRKALEPRLRGQPQLPPRRGLQGQILVQDDIGPAPIAMPGTTTAATFRGKAGTWLSRTQQRREGREPVAPALQSSPRPNMASRASPDMAYSSSPGQLLH